MLREVERFCREHGVVRPGEGIVVACSGGADSMALVQWLMEHRQQWKLRLCVAHFEHGIRGEESLQDAAFVEKWCAEHRLMFRMGSARIPELAAKAGVSLELAARKQRYGFLEGLRQELGYDVIATAHHADDQAETVLMRLLRGSGIDGLAAMLPRTGCIARPFLSVRKRELEEFCAARGIAARYDATNGMPDCTRNRLRLELMPRLQREYNPNLVEALCHLARLAAEQREYMGGEVSRVFPAAVRRGGMELSQEVFCEQPPALQCALLRRFLQEGGAGCRDLGFQHFESLRGFLLHRGTGSHMELPGGWKAELSYGWLRLRRQEEADGMPLPERRIAVPGRTLLREYGISIEAEILSEKPVHTGPEEFYCDYGKLPEDLAVRPRRAGDVISLPAGRKSLKKLFIDSHVPREERNRIPVLVSSGMVLWVPGLRRSVLCPVDGDTGKILYLRVMKEEVRGHDEG